MLIDPNNIHFPFTRTMREVEDFQKNINLPECMVEILQFGVLK